MAGPERGVTDSEWIAFETRGLRRPYLDAEGGVMSDLVEHLRDYATAAWMEIEVTAQASGWSGAMSRAADEIERLRAALKFYADAESWADHGDVESYISAARTDGGTIARHAVAQKSDGGT